MEKAWGSGDSEAMWLEAAAGVQSELDVEVRDEAFEVFVAESARIRVQDRVGRARLTLRCGHVLEGDLRGDDAIEGHVRLQDASGRSLVVPLRALTTVTGSRPGLRQEGRERTLASWLREAWATGDRLRLLTRDGRCFVGALTHVGADHVDIVSGGEATTIPYDAVDVWMVP